MALARIKMSYVFEVTRGWLEGALDTNDTVTDASVTGGLGNGDIVTLSSSGTLIKVTTPVHACGFVLSGEKNSSSSIAAGGLPVILWRNFVARTQNYNTASSWAPGVNVTVKNNKLDVANGTTDPVIGYVKKVNAPVGSTPGDIEFVKF